MTGIKANNTKIEPLNYKESGLGKEEWAILKKLSTPGKIQDYINTLPFNFEEKGETYMSVGRSLSAKKAHCFEGALIAAAALWIHGEKPLILDLGADPKLDDDHVVTLFMRDGFWGAISKTNHSVLRYREPIYRDMRELAVSYFHEYFLDDGLKNLRTFSAPFDLRRSGSDWISSKEDLHDVVNELENSPHTKILSPSQKRGLRPADKIEIETLDLLEYREPKGFR